jgi:hypothetical protein
MSTLGLFFTTLVAASILSDSLIIDSNNAYRFQCRSSRSMQIQMTSTTDDMVIAYEKIKQQV